jgi:hypothetical protein
MGADDRPGPGAWVAAHQPPLYGIVNLGRPRLRVRVCVRVRLLRGRGKGRERVELLWRSVSHDHLLLVVVVVDRHGPRIPHTGTILVLVLMSRTVRLGPSFRSQPRSRPVQDEMCLWLLMIDPILGAGAGEVGGIRLMAFGDGRTSWLRDGGFVLILVVNGSGRRRRRSRKGDHRSEVEVEAILVGPVG